MREEVVFSENHACVLGLSGPFVLFSLFAFSLLVVAFSECFDEKLDLLFWYTVDILVAVRPTLGRRIESDGIWSILSAHMCVCLFVCVCVHGMLYIYQFTRHDMVVQAEVAVVVVVVVVEGARLVGWLAGIAS